MRKPETSFDVVRCLQCNKELSGIEKSESKCFCGSIFILTKEGLIFLVPSCMSSAEPNTMHAYFKGF